MTGYVEACELSEFGVSLDSIKKPLLRFRQGLSESWENVKDPSDKRKVLIRYDTIPLTTIRKYQLPENYFEFIRVRNYKKLSFNNYKNEYTENCIEFEILKHALEVEFHQHVEPYYVLLSETKCIPTKRHKKAEILAKRHALYNVFMENTGGVDRTIKGSIKQQFEQIKFFKKYNVVPEKFNDYTQFSRNIYKLKTYLQKGYTFYDILVQDSHYQRKKTTTDEYHTGVLVFYATNPKHYSIRQLTEFVNYHASLDNKLEISESWVKNKLYNPFDRSLKTIIDSGRRGAKYKNDAILPYLSRNQSMHPNNTWFIDGTPIQMYYKDSAGNARRLYLFVVLDACTRKIIGFDINTSGEDRFMIMNAIKMAIMITKHIPYEIVSDNFSANKTDEIKALQSELLKHGTFWRFAKVGNPQDKSYVERFNGTFQSMEQSLLEEYLGEGITSRRDNGRIDSEFIKEVIKKKGLYSSEKMKDFVAGLICIYNDKSISGRLSPNEAEQKLAIDKAKPLDIATLSKLFWIKTVSTVKRGQINLSINNIKYEYDIWDKELILKYQDSKVIVRYDPKKPDTINIYDIHTDFFIKECKLKIKGYASNAEMPEGGEQIIIKHHAHKKSVAKYIEDETKRLIETGLATVDKTLENFDAVSALDLNKHHLNASESIEMLKIYGLIQDREINSLNDYESIANNGVPTTQREKKSKRISEQFKEGTNKKTLQSYEDEA